HLGCALLKATREACGDDVVDPGPAAHDQPEPIVAEPIPDRVGAPALLLLQSELSAGAGDHHPAHRSGDCLSAENVFGAALHAPERDIKLDLQGSAFCPERERTACRGDGLSASGATETHLRLGLSHGRSPRYRWRCKPNMTDLEIIGLARSSVFGPLNGACCSWPSWISRAHPISFASRPRRAACATRSRT